jgi:propanediol dehydratase small subunit
MEWSPASDYPLGARRPDLVSTPSGIPLDRLDWEAARAGGLPPNDLRATASTLRLQADVARAAGRHQLADNLERAAELTAVSEEDLLAIYTALRPGRATRAELERWAGRLDELGASKTAGFVREAAEAHAARSLTAD